MPHNYNDPKNRNNWETPDELFRALDDKFDFVFDAAASKENRKCQRFFSIEDNALEQPWPTDGAIFVNPPFSQPNDEGSYGLMAWLQKVYDESQVAPRPIIAITPGDLSTQWFDVFYPLAKAIRVCTPRVHFVPPPTVKASSPQGTSAVWWFGWGPKPDRPITLWRWKEGW